VASGAYDERFDGDVRTSLDRMRSEQNTQRRHD